MKVAIYVDAQHLWHAARSYGETRGFDQARPDYEAIIVEAIKLAKERSGDQTVEIVRQIVYSVSRSRAIGFEQALARLGYEVRNRILKSRTDSFDWDTQLAVDAVRDAQLVDLVIVVSGDGDIAPVLQAVRELGTEAVACGFPGSTSSRFVNPHLLDDRAIYENNR